MFGEYEGLQGLVADWSAIGGSVQELVDYSEKEPDSMRELAAAYGIDDQELDGLTELVEPTAEQAESASEGSAELEPRHVWVKRIVGEMAEKRKALRHAEVELQDTGQRRRRMRPEEALAYRDALDRAEEVADERYFAGLEELIRRARETGDSTLERACWDVARARDEEQVGQDWVETLRLALGMETDSASLSMGVKTSGSPIGVGSVQQG